MSDTKLTKDQIEQILDRKIPAPQSHRCLTLERQIDFCLRSIAQEVALCDPNAVVRTETAARDSKGNLLLDGDGAPKIIAATVLKRDVAGAHWKKMLADVRASYARRLQKSNAEHSQDGEALQRALKGEFGDDRAGLSAEVSAFARAYQVEHGHYHG